LKRIEIIKVEGIRRNAFEDDFLYLNGRILFELKKYDEAINCYRKLKERNPENLDYRYKLACAYGLNNEQEEAVVILEEINKQTPGMLYIVKKLGHAYDQIKEYKKARAFFNFALKLNPDDQIIRRRLDEYDKYFTLLGY